MKNAQDANEALFAGTVIKAMDIVDCLADSRRPLSTQEVAAACGLSRPTAYRLLTTLISRGYVRQTGNFQFALGTRLLTLSRLVLYDLDLLEIARPYLHELCSVSNETANLSILDDGELLYIGKQESQRGSQLPTSVQLRSTVGTRIPPHSSAMGKAMMAYLPEAALADLLEKRTPLKRFTPYTITDTAVLRAQFSEIRRLGFAIDEREVDEGTRCIGAPVFDSSGRVAGAMSISGPAYRVTLEGLHELAPALVRVSQDVSRQLGYSGVPAGEAD